MKMKNRDPRAPEMMAAVGSTVPPAPSKSLDWGGVQVGAGQLVELEVWLPSMGQPEGQTPADALGAGLRPVGRANLWRRSSHRSGRIWQSTVKTVYFLFTCWLWGKPSTVIFLIEFGWNRCLCMYIVCKCKLVRKWQGVWYHMSLWGQGPNASCVAGNVLVNNGVSRISYS